MKKKENTDDNDLIFVEVSTTYLMSKRQARKIVKVARIIEAETVSIEFDEGGNRLVIEGEDFLLPDGCEDFSAALSAIHLNIAPESSFGIEMVEQSTHQLEDAAVKELSQSWSNGWQQEFLGRPNNEPK